MWRLIAKSGAVSSFSFPTLRTWPSNRSYLMRTRSWSRRGPPQIRPSVPAVALPALPGGFDSSAPWRCALPVNGSTGPPAATARPCPPCPTSRTRPEPWPCRPPRNSGIVPWPEPRGQAPACLNSLGMVLRLPSINKLESRSSPLKILTQRAVDVQHIGRAGSGPANRAGWCGLRHAKRRGRAVAAPQHGHNMGRVPRKAW